MYNDNDSDGGVITAAVMAVALILGLWIAAIVQIWHADWHHGVKFAIAGIVTSIVANIGLTLHWFVCMIAVVGMSVFWLAVF